jgi:hypothetical protein
VLFLHGKFALVHFAGPHKLILTLDPGYQPSQIPPEALEQSLFGIANCAFTIQDADATHRRKISVTHAIERFLYHNLHTLHSHPSHPCFVGRKIRRSIPLIPCLHWAACELWHVSYLRLYFFNDTNLTGRTAMSSIFSHSLSLKNLINKADSLVPPSCLPSFSFPRVRLLFGPQPQTQLCLLSAI